MLTKSTSTGQTIQAADSILAAITLMDLTWSTERLIHRLIEEYGNCRERDGLAVGKLVAEQEQRNKEFRLASFNEQRNKDLLRDVVQVISEYYDMERSPDDVPF